MYIILNEWMDGSIQNNIKSFICTWIISSRANSLCTHTSTTFKVYTYNYLTTHMLIFTERENRSTLRKTLVVWERTIFGHVMRKTKLGNVFHICWWAFCVTCSWRGLSLEISFEVMGFLCLKSWVGLKKRWSYLFWNKADFFSWASCVLLVEGD